MKNSTPTLSQQELEAGARMWRWLGVVCFLVAGTIEALIAESNGSS